MYLVFMAPSSSWVRITRFQREKVGSMPTGATTFRYIQQEKLLCQTVGVGATPALPANIGR